MELKLSDSQVTQLYDKIRETNKQRYAEQCRQRLDHIISTKIRTTFIGAIDQFEKSFGFLWGSDTEDKTDSQQEMYQLFLQARTNILNLGNRELRAAKNEIANHSIQWNRYQTEFQVLPVTKTGETNHG